MIQEVSKEDLIVGLIQNHGLPLTTIVKILRTNNKEEITKILKEWKKNSHQ